MRANACEYLLPSEADRPSVKPLTLLTRSFLIITTLLFCTLLGSNSAHGQSRHDESDVFIERLQSHPEDEALLQRVTDWTMQRGGLESLLSRLQSQKPISTVNNYLSGRLLEESGQIVRAFTYYELAVSQSQSTQSKASSLSRIALIRLLLRANWGERAKEVWQDGEGLNVSGLQSEEIQFLLSLKLEGEEAARRFLKSAKNANSRQKAIWAQQANAPALAASLWEEMEEWEPALHSWVAAGQRQHALRIYKQARAKNLFEVQDDLVLSLARISGDAALLEEHLGDRQDSAAVRCRKQMKLSLGSLGSDATSEAISLNPRIGINEAGSTNSANSNQSNSENSDDASTNSNGGNQNISEEEESNYDERIILAKRIITSGRNKLTDTETKLLQSAGNPSLAVVRAFLLLGNEAYARREWTLWQLQPQQQEKAKWFPALSRLKPSWFPENIDARQVLKEAEACLKVTEAIRKSIVQKINIALSKTSAGSNLEAQLLYQRGRIAKDPADLERALQIHPSAPVGQRHTEFRRVVSLRDAVTEEQGVPLQWPLLLTKPDPIDQIVGLQKGQPTRFRSVPGRGGLKYRIDRWEVPKPDPIVDASLVGLQSMNASGLLLDAKNSRWSAGALSPIHTVIRLPKNGWLVVGRGLALISENPIREVMRFESPEIWDIDSIPESVYPLLTEAVRSTLSYFKAPDRILWTQAHEFLDKLKERFGNDELYWHGQYAVGNRLLLRSNTGVRLWLRATDRADNGQSLVTKVTQIQGYKNLDGLWVRKDADLASALIQKNTSPPEQSYSSRNWSKVDQYSLPIPTRSDPELELAKQIKKRTGSKSFELPPEFSNQEVLQRVGFDPQVVLSTGGQILFYSSESKQALWIRQIETPLPGPQGFGKRPPLTTGGIDVSWTGPVATEHQPRISLHGKDFFIVTDRIDRYQFWGSQERLPFPRFTKGVRDLAREETHNEVYVLPAPGDKVMGMDIESGTRKEWQVPRGGAFDIEVVKNRLFALAFQKNRFVLFATDKLSNKLREQQIPYLEWEDDRGGLRLTSLGRYANHLLLLHFDMHICNADQIKIRWRKMMSWPSQNPAAYPFYLQTRPMVRGGNLYLTRPWGALEIWGPKRW